MLLCISIRAGKQRGVNEPAVSLLYYTHRLHQERGNTRAGRMGFGTDSIVRGRRSAAALLNSVSRTSLAALSLGLALGVALPGEARAGAGTVNPVQTSTYSLGTHNPTTFGGGTNINAATPSSVGVYGGSSTPWNVTNYGAIQGPSAGLYLRASGSTVTNWGAIRGNAGAGIQLPNGGAVTNESGGSIKI